MPFDPFSSLNLYYDGVSGAYWYDDSGSGFRPNDTPFPGGGGDGGTNGLNGFTNNFNIQTFSYSTNLWQYTNFWLTVNISPTNSHTAVIGVESTLPGLIYQIQTNPALTVSNWVPWTNLLATDTNILAPPLFIGTNNLFYRGKIVLPNSSYITNGLVACWRMNDATGTNAADSSGNGLTMPLIGSPYWGPGSLILNGSTQYGDAGSSALTSLDQHDKTICAWINMATNVPITSYFEGIVDKSQNASSGGWLFAVSYLNQLAWSVGSPNNDTYYDSGKGVILTNQWEFVTITWSYSSSANSVASFYINGLFNSAVSLSSAEAASGGEPLTVGTLHNNIYAGANNFQGSIRDVAIYNRVLSAAEVKSNFLSSAYSTNVPVPDLLYYKLNTGSSNEAGPQTVYDSSTIGTNNGTIESVTSPDNDGIFWNNGITGIPGNLSDDPASNNYKSLHLHGEAQNYIDTFNTNLFQLTTNLFTINLWVSPYTSGGTLLETGVPLVNGWYVACAGGNSYAVIFGTETNGVDKQVVTQTGAIPSTVWTMLSIVKTTPTNAIIYLNGLSVTNQPTIICAPSTTSLQIGKTPGSSEGYDGDLWGIQIWNEPLSAAAIALLYLNSSNAVNYP